MSNIQSALEDLAACLCLGVQEGSGGDVCFCGVTPGGGVMELWSQCAAQSKCGLAYVRLVSSYPSSIVGQQDITEGNCSAGIGFDVEVGIYRCFPLRADGKAPDGDTLLAVSRQQQEDVETMRTAITCCEWVPRRDFVMGQYTPIGPEGGMIGGTWQLSGWVASGNTVTQDA